MTSPSKLRAYKWSVLWLLALPHVKRRRITPVVLRCVTYITGAGAVQVLDHVHARNCIGIARFSANLLRVEPGFRAQRSRGKLQVHLASRSDNFLSGAVGKPRPISLPLARHASFARRYAFEVRGKTTAGSAVLSM